MSVAIFLGLALVVVAAILYPLLPVRVPTRQVPPASADEIAQDVGELLCPTCGQACQTGDRFCVRCGRALAEREGG